MSVDNVSVEPVVIEMAPSLTAAENDQGLPKTDKWKWRNQHFHRNSPIIVSDRLVSEACKRCVQVNSRQESRAHVQTRKY